MTEDSAVDALRSSILRTIAVVSLLSFLALSIAGNFDPPWVRTLLAFAALLSGAAVLWVLRRGTSLAFGLVYLAWLMCIVTVIALTVQPAALGTITGFVFLGLAVSVAAIEPPRVAIIFDTAAVLLGVVAISLRSSIPLFAGGVLVAVSALAVFVVIRYRVILQESRDHAISEALRDPLTGVLNRRGMNQHVGVLSAVAHRTDQRLGCLVLDIDHFKRVNDRYGHETGDAVLRTFAEIVSESSRAGDLVVRLGGEEFALFTLVPDQDTLSVIAERLRLRVEAATAAPVTVSIGGAALAGGPAFELSRLLRSCDRALYAAKSGGRNAVRIAEAAH